VSSAQCALTREDFHGRPGDSSGHTITYVTVYIGWEGSQWRYGVGLQICGAQHIRIFGCSEDPSGDRDDYHFPIYYWG
jgi:hypothetical protein